MRLGVRRIVALAAVTGLYFAARLPQLPDAEREQMAGRYHFAGLALPEAPGAHEHRTVRAVHPSLQHICAWISSVGAGVALNDIDGDGLPNDVCYVDPRTDVVTVAPVPGTAARYPAFELNPAPLPYDPATMAPMGSLPGDFNEDGLEDIMVYYWGRTPVLFLRTTGSDGAGLSRASYVARELAPMNVRVNALCPGFFPAEQNRKILDPARVEKIMAQTPMNRFGEPHELVGATILLLSKQAGSFITGASYYVDGGFTAMRL